MATATLSFGNGKTSTIQTGLYINGKFTPALDGKTFGVVNPTDGKEICNVSEASAKDVDAAVKAARHAFENSWGQKVSVFEMAFTEARLAAAKY